MTIFCSIPKCFLGQVVFGRPWVSRPNNHTFLGTEWVFGKAKQPPVSGTCVVFWPWYPRPPKTTWPINHYGIPLNSAITHKEPALHRRRCPAEFKDHRLVPNVWAEDSSNKLPWHPNHTPTCCDRRTRHHATTACSATQYGISIYGISTCRECSNLPFVI